MSRPVEATPRRDADDDEGQSDPGGDSDVRPDPARTPDDDTPEAQSQRAPAALEPGARSHPLPPRGLARGPFSMTRSQLSPR